MKTKQLPTCTRSQGRTHSITRKGSAYLRSPPETFRPQISFHEPLSDTLAALNERVIQFAARPERACQALDRARLHRCEYLLSLSAVVARPRPTRHR